MTAANEQIIIEPLEPAPMWIDLHMERTQAAAYAEEQENCASETI